MDSMVSYNFLFIAGAPRSGTTLLHNLLDNHPNILCFPFEHATIERFFWNGADRKYFENDFIQKRSEGQQAILSSDEELKKYAQKIKNEYKKEFSLNIASDAFVIAYKAYLSNKAISLEAILMALTEGLLSANNYAAEKKKQIEWVVFKQPYYTELFANQVKKELPSAKFIHINRDPISRYVSAKKRRITTMKKLGRRLGHINRVSFVEGHTEVGVSSKYLGFENQKGIGEDYKIISFEALVSNPEQMLKEKLNWLDIGIHGSLGQVTRLGQPASSGSLMSNSDKVDAQAKNRIKEYVKITNWSERTVHAFLLNSTKQKSILTFAKVSIATLIPFKYSSIKNYMFQLYLALRIFYIDFSTSLRLRLLNGVKLGSMFLSGNI